MSKFQWSKVDPNFEWSKVDPNAPTDRADFVVQWVKSLFDPSSRQAKGNLQKKSGNTCCLGNACLVANIEKIYDKDDKTFYFGLEGDNSFLPKELKKFLQMTSSGGFIYNIQYKRNDDGFKIRKLLGGVQSLVEANDNQVSFYKIAQAIYKYPRGFLENLSIEEETYIQTEGAKLQPTWQDYVKARKAINDQRKAKKGDTGNAIPDA